MFFQILVEQTTMECQEYCHTRAFQQGTFTSSKSKFQIPIRYPDLVIVLNTLESTNYEHAMIPECAKMRIPVIGVVDTNCDPRLITYPVPGNDDSHTAVSFYCRVFKESILAGKRKREELLSDNV